MIHFNSKTEFSAYIDAEIGQNRCPRLVQYSDSTTMYYDLNLNQLYFFNDKDKRGLVGGFSEVSGFLGVRDTHLRNSIARSILSVENSRNNLVDITPEQFWQDYFNKPVFTDKLLNSTYEALGSNEFKNKLISLSEYLNQIDRETIMNEYETPLLVIFSHYLRKVKGVELDVTTCENFLGETCLCVNVKDKNYNYKHDITWLLYIVLYPDYNRDDYDNEEDVKINLEGMRQLLDRY